MKVNPSKYKLVDEGKHHYMFEHPDGTQFTVAKQPLNPVMHEKIKMMAYGGEVEDPEADLEMPKVAAFDPTPKVSQETLEIDKKKAEERAALEKARAEEEAAAIEASRAKIAESAMSNDMQKAGLESRGLIPKAPVIPKEEIQPIEERTPAASPVQGPAAPTYLQKIESGQALQLQGIREGADAQAKAAEAQANAYAQQMAQEKIIADKYLERRKIQDERTEKAYQDVLNSKVDPNHYWNSMDTGNKVLAGIAMLLSGMGQGLIGGENTALKVIDKAIDRDIEGQKMDLNKKNTLLSRNLEITGNMESALARTKADMYAATTAKINMAAARSNSALAKAQAKIAEGEFIQKASELNKGIATKEALSSGTVGINPENLDEKTRERFVQLPDGKPALAYTPEAAKTVRDASIVKADMDDLSRRMRNLINQGTTLPKTQRDAEAKSLEAQALLLTKDIGKLGVLSQQDEKIVKSIIPEGASWFNKNQLAKLDEMDKWSDGKFESVKKANITNYKPAFKPSTPTKRFGE